MAAMPGRDGPTSSGASFRLDHGGKRGKVPAHRSKLVRLELGGPPIWATSIARSWGRRLGRAGQGALMYGWGRANHKQ